MPTMVWKAIRTTLTGGWSASGTMSSPWTTADGLWEASSDSSRGISMPQTTEWPLYQPRRCSAAPRVVVASPSIAASFTGWYRDTSRAAQSPTMTCSGAATDAVPSDTASAVRS
jgi:predicted nucleic acid-binding Zn ribbon protein